MTAGVEVVYTTESDADMFIMAEARAQREAGAPRVVVVSGDTEISASLAYGRAMGWMTSEMFMLEMKRVRRPPSLCSSWREDSSSTQWSCRHWS